MMLKGILLIGLLELLPILVQARQTVNPRQKRQGAFDTSRTTNEPFLDTDETGGANLIANILHLTHAPVMEDLGVTPASVQVTAQPRGPLPVTIQCPACLGGTAIVTSPAPPTTTYSGILANSPYPFVLPPPDIPYFGSKWNGPWGFPLGQYQSFRGTGQYIPHYQYYPLSYFGSFMTPYRYGLSGKK